MSFHWCDSNIHTTVFTPRDHQVELLSAAFERNTTICLLHKSSKEFIAMKLVQEMYRQARTDEKIFLYVTEDHGDSTMNTMLTHLTGLTVYEQPKNVSTLECLPPGYMVYIVTPSSVLKALESASLSLTQVQLMVFEDCHRNDMYEAIMDIFRTFYDFEAVIKMPKILGLAGPIHSAACGLEELSTMLSAMEKTVNCRVETASDIVTVLRYCAKPNEIIIQCAPYRMNDLTALLEDVICTRIVFLHDHRYDPFEIYNSDEYLEELKEIPDPKKEPLEILTRLLSVLHELGPWAADRLSSFLYYYIEKQKINTPHERHYILLCMVSTVLSEIRCLCEQAFRQVNDRRALIETYSSPKVLKLLQIMRLFKPEEVASDHSTINKMNKQLEQVDFQRLTRSLDQTCHSVENIHSRQQLESRSIVENLDPIIKSDFVTPDELRKRLSYTAPRATQRTTERHKNHNHTNPNQRRRDPRTRRRPFIRRNQRSHHDSSDSLCGLIFCNNDYIARILFELVCEMSRNDPTLKYLKCQYTMDRVADPLKNPKEAEQEHRREEDVLKRFRMHECNLLITTPLLEEGIDVPKCNLVVRWDPPTTYRSYVQCKGRARAAPAYYIILVAPKFQMSVDELHSRQEMLSGRNHRWICENNQNDGMEANWSDTDSPAGSSEESSEERSSKSGQFTIASSRGTVKILNPEIITDKPPTTAVDLKLTDGNVAAIEEATGKLSLTEIKQSSRQATDKKEPESLNSSIASHDTSLEEKYGFEIRNVDEMLAEKGLTTMSHHKQDKVDDSNGEASVAIEKSNKVGKVKKEAPRKFQCHMKTAKRGEDDLYFQTLYQRSLHEMENTTALIVQQMAHYREIEKLLLLKCANTEPSESEHQKADLYTGCVQAYKPVPELLTSASVDLGTSIALINKYCSKLPSDTFTKLTALWRCSTANRNGSTVYQCTLRLPINSPLKYDIVGMPMGSLVLARRMVALQACMELHKMGELDDNLQPIGKEGFRAIEPDWETFELEEQDERRVTENCEPRPGTTKRRQYYYKRIASEFCNCRPTTDTPCYLYFLDLTLQCPIPEEQNTRGRRIYPPEEAQQGFGILTLKKIPKVSSFPIFTRSGEVKVAIQLAKEKIVLTDEQIRCINTFLNYTFTNVLRLQKFLMLFDPESTENCVFIVPTIRRDDNTKVIDWDFLRLIERNATMMPTPVPEEQRRNVEFDASRFKDAVVMPWYRNQDQPQYFYVAEICPQLSPLSCFPGENYRTFKHYYHLKYQLNIQDCKQPLLDVDHTSARLNFLTPRYVNRKGVALPTSSEETKRAKRENLEQKQILVPELCTVHPFPASLWRTAVCLPCILYRINGLLLADDIRKKVSTDIGLGQHDVPDDFEWPMLDFGWSLSEVLRKSKETKLQTQKDDATAQQDTAGESKTKKANAAKENGGEPSNGPEIKVEKSANEIVIEGEKKLQDTSFVEIGTWSNDMANNMSNNRPSNGYTEEDEEAFMNYLPPNVSFCDQKIRYGSPTFWGTDDKKPTTMGGSSSKPSSKSTPQANATKNFTYAYYDSDDSLDSTCEAGPRVTNYQTSDEDEYDEESGHFAFRSKNEAETIESPEECEKRQKQLSIIQATNANERNYQQTKNLQVGYDYSKVRREITAELHDAMLEFHESIASLKENITQSGMLVKYDSDIVLPKRLRESNAVASETAVPAEAFHEMLPYADRQTLNEIVQECNILTVDNIKELNLRYVRSQPNEIFTIPGSGSAFDNFNDYDKMSALLNGPEVVLKIRLNFDDAKKTQRSEAAQAAAAPHSEQNNVHSSLSSISGFSFDYQPDLRNHPGPSPSIILQGLTMSNANDGINLERLETIGDSFLKYAITTYLYITYENVHEGKLSHLRSKQVANLNLYRLGRRKVLGEYMIATKFEPHDNWLPPCYYVPKELEKALIEAKVYEPLQNVVNYLGQANVYIADGNGKDIQNVTNTQSTSSDLSILQIPPHHWKLVDLPNIKKLSSAEICALVKEKVDSLGLSDEDLCAGNEEHADDTDDEKSDSKDFSCFIPYNLVTQHSIPDKSVADCVEALIGAYLIECGSRGALLFMAWLGIRVVPMSRKPYDPKEPRVPGSTLPDKENMITVYGEWPAPKSPLLNYSPNASMELEAMLKGFDEFERTLGYKFRDRSYLLQAMTHASYSPNRLTDCYQRLEFLGDAVLDYLITRHLYEDPRQHSPGALTDLRSALVNNTIFASLAVRHGFHKYFRHLSPGLNEVIDRFVRIQNENGHSISEEYYLLSEEECDDAEDVEVPKALGDVFESVAGAIFLDSNMSLDVVWRVYSNMMKPEIEQFSNSVPKSPIRELLELEPETAKFGKPEKLADGRRVRVTVDVFCKGVFRGIGRNYRIAKCTAAKCALRQLKKQGLIAKKD